MKRAGRFGVPVLAALLLIATSPARADAQIGWIKGLFGKKSKPPAEQAAPTPAASPAGAAPAAVTPAAGAQGGAATPPSFANPAPAGSSGAPGTAGAAAPSVPEIDVKQLEYGRMLDAEPPTLESTRRRVDHWQVMKLTLPFNPEVAQRYDAALRAYEEAKAKDSTTKAASITMEQANKKLDQAVYALRANSFSDAESIADDILTTDPNNERAKALKAAAVKGQQASKLKYTLMALGAAAVALFALFAAFSGKIFKKKEGEEKPADRGSGKAAAGGAKVYLKVVDGVARGRLVAIAGDVFRIGATSGTSDDDRNDLVISDDQQSVSRFHCSVVRKGRDYFLIDSSLNGTRLNDKPLARGESHRLRDGDEFTVADVSLIKFVKT